MSTTNRQIMIWKECDRRIPAGSARLRRDVSCQAFPNLNNSPIF